MQVDASQKGLGAVLYQDKGPVAYASKAMNETQQNYAQIEKELLAIVFGCKRFHQYIYGKRVVIETDHKPLEAIFNEPLSQAPSRLQRMLLQLQGYDIDLMYKKGTEMYIADALSRAFPPEIVIDDFEREIRWLDWVFRWRYLPCLNGKYVAVDKLIYNQFLYQV